MSELSKYGEKALPVLEEVLNVSAYDEVKKACVEAIKAVRAGGKIEPSKSGATSSEAADSGSSKNQKKEGEQEVTNVYGPTLADLPP